MTWLKSQWQVRYWGWGGSCYCFVGEETGSWRAFSILSCGFCFFKEVKSLEGCGGAPTCIASWSRRTQWSLIPLRKLLSLVTCVWTCCWLGRVCPCLDSLLYTIPCLDAWNSTWPVFLKSPNFTWIEAAQPKIWLYATKKDDISFERFKLSICESYARVQCISNTWARKSQTGDPHSNFL